MHSINDVINKIKKESLIIIKSISPGKRPPSSIHCLYVCVAQVQLAPHQNNRSARAEVLDFWVPHGFDMKEGVRVCYGEAQDHHI